MNYLVLKQRIYLVISVLTLISFRQWLRLLHKVFRQVI